MNDEERQRTMDFILSQQAKVSTDIEKSEARIARLERTLKLAIRAGLRERREWRERYAALVDAQIRNEDALNRLTATQEQMQESQERTQESQEWMQESQARMQERQERMQESQAQTQESLQRTEEIVRRNSEDINRLARIVERASTDRNGGDGGDGRDGEDGH